MIENRDVFGQWVAQKRVALGLTQERLADQLDVTTSYIARIERGKARIEKLTDAQLKAMATALCVSLDAVQLAAKGEPLLALLLQNDLTRLLRAIAMADVDSISLIELLHLLRVQAQVQCAEDITLSREQIKQILKSRVCQ